MALWSSGVTWSSNILWGPSVIPAGPTHTNTKKKRNTMQRDDYYPTRIAERPEWHANFAAKFQIYGPLLGYPAAEVNAAVADNLYLAYGLGDWVSGVREFGPACTAALKTLATGTGSAPFVFTPYTAPALPTLPAGITAVLPGALDRTFGLVQGVKGKPGYTDDMGLDMGIVGSEKPAPPPGEAPAPRITVAAIPGDAHEYARVKYFKDGHEALQIQGRRGGGNWEDLAMSYKSPFIDERPLLVAGQAEVREYRARFYDRGVYTSGWCDVAKVTVGP
jgi:hypothetical protein